jgi:hypothetical protein
MADRPEHPRLDDVVFRGVSNRLPPRAVDDPPPSLAPRSEPDPAPPTPPRPATPTYPQPTGTARRGRSRTPTATSTASQSDPPGPRSRVGTGQLHARLPIHLAEWIKHQDLTQRALLLAAFADHGGDVAASTDPTVIIRQRLGLPVRPTQKRRGPTELINFSLTGEEKDLIEARAGQLSLSIVEFVTEILRRAQQTGPQYA